MDDARFDGLTRALARSRRSLISGGLAVAAGRLGMVDADARKKRRHKKRKKRQPQATPNQYGCLEINDPCTGADDCCSGICEGKKCRAHGAGTCAQNEPGLCEAGNPLDTICNGTQCLCVRTTAGSNYCGTLLMPSACADCGKDADCEAQGFPPGTACVPFVGEFSCAGQCQETGTACIVPCGTPLPEG
jgi:hypothetical protein